MSLVPFLALCLLGAVLSVALGASWLASVFFGLLYIVPRVLAQARRQELARLARARRNAGRYTCRG